MRNHHVQMLGMSQTVLYLCLFYKHHHSVLSGAQGTLVDDTISLGTASFSERENDSSKKLESNPKKGTLPILFGDILISAASAGMAVSQFDYTESL